MVSMSLVCRRLVAMLIVAWFAERWGWVFGLCPEGRCVHLLVWVCCPARPRVPVGWLGSFYWNKTAFPLRGAPALRLQEGPGQRCLVLWGASGVQEVVEFD